MSIKIVHENTFKTILSATNKLCDFVAPTFGPANNKAIIAKSIYFSPLVIDDGVQIARDFELEDEAEQAVIRVIKEAAIRTNDRVGDGTTSSLLMLQAIMQEIAKQHVRDGRKISTELKKGAEEAKGLLHKAAKQISSEEDLERVARISFDDPQIARIIAELYSQTGKEGIITVEAFASLANMQTSYERSDGIEIASGLISPYMVTDTIRMEADLSLPRILITDYRLTNATDILPVMEMLVQHGERQLMLIADNVESDALATIVANRQQGKFNCIAIATPQGPDKNEYLEDLALLTGATVFNSEKGNKVAEAKFEELGKAKRVVSNQRKTLIMGAAGKKVEIEKQKEAIRKQLAGAIKDADKLNAEARLARLNNGIAIIRVGAATEAEQKSLRYKVEDAVNAVRTAYTSGIVCGAGIALANLNTSSPILNKALKHPLSQLKKNMDMEDIELKPNEAVNVVTGERGNYLKVGVVDPVEVLIAGIESAVSIACMLATTHGIIYEVSDKKE